MLHALLNRRGTISRTTLTDLGGGQWKEDRGAHAADVPFRSWPGSAREIELGRALGLDVTHKATFLIGTDIRRGDRLADAASGQEYDVLRADPDGSHHHLEVFLREREIEAVAP